MSTTQQIFNNSMLAQASYSTGLSVGMGGKNKNEQVIQYATFNKDHEIVNPLTDGDFNANLTISQASTFANEYTVTAISTGIGSASGFSATLFTDSNGHKTLAIRGTQDFADLITDVALGTNSPIILAQTQALESFYNKLIADGIIKPGEKIDVTGHSLGGFLSQIFTINHPDAVNHTYTYNAPGLGGVQAQLLESLGVMTKNIPYEKITNVIANDGVTAIAGWGTLIGEIVKIDGSSHSIGTVTNQLDTLNSQSVELHAEPMKKTIFQTLWHTGVEVYNEVTSWSAQALQQMNDYFTNLWNYATGENNKPLDMRVLKAESDHVSFEAVILKDNTSLIQTTNTLTSQTSAKAYNNNGEMIGNTHSYSPINSPMTLMPNSTSSTLESFQTIMARGHKNSNEETLAVA